MEFERAPAEDLWRNTLSQIETSFGRLVYLSSLRDPNTGAYEHFGLSQIFGEAESQRTLRASHGVVFAEWLELSLEAKKRDLDDYLSSLGRDPRSVIATWLRISPHRNLMPLDVLLAERELFLSEVRMLLELLKREHDVASPGPDA
jgi:hypothetical protein